MTRTEVHVDFNTEKNRFELTVPFAYSGVAQSMPSRKWNKVARKWFAPAIRKNAEHITRTIATMTCANITDKAAEAIGDCLHKAHDRERQAFPSWYNHKMPPRGYQQKGLDKLYALPYAAMFMVMGSGKSKMAVDLVSARAMTPGELNIDAVVIACPYSIRRNWIKQLATHCPIAYHAEVLDFATKASRQAIEEMKADTDKLRVMVVGIESLSTGRAGKYVQDFMLATKAAFVVDESSRIKNHSSKRTKNITALGRLCKYRLALTGTPITQGIIDLYAQMEFLSPNIIGCGDYYSFRNMYAVMGGFNNKEIIAYKDTDDLMASIKPYVFQATAEEALPELPERTYMVREVSLTKEQKEQYNNINDSKMIIHGDDRVEVQNALEKLMRLQQVTGGFTVTKKIDPITDKEVTSVVAMPSSKVAEVLNIAEESNSSTIVWCRFRPEIALVAAELRKVYGHKAVVEFHGGVDADTRWKNVERFESKQARFFVGNQTTGGIGLDLLAATLVIYYSNTFSYEDRVQSEARNHRIGQKNPVTYIDLQCINTIDTHVVEVIKEKGDMASFVKEAIRNNRDPLQALVH